MRDSDLAYMGVSSNIRSMSSYAVVPGFVFKVTCLAADIDKYAVDCFALASLFLNVSTSAVGTSLLIIACFTSLCTGSYRAKGSVLTMQRGGGYDMEQLINNIT